MRDLIGIMFLCLFEMRCETHPVERYFFIESGKKDSPIDQLSSSPIRANSHPVRLSSRAPLRPLRPTAILKPKHYIRSADPAHPEMRTYIDEDNAMSANLLPENSYWKDHDSQVS